MMKNTTTLQSSSSSLSSSPWIFPNFHNDKIRFLERYRRPYRRRNNQQQQQYQNQQPHQNQQQHHCNNDTNQYQQQEEEEEEEYWTFIPSGPFLRKYLALFEYIWGGGGGDSGGGNYTTTSTSSSSIHKMLNVRVSLVLLESVAECMDRRNSSPIFISIDNTNDHETMNKDGGDDKSKDNDNNDGGDSDPNSNSSRHQICEIAGRNERKRIVKLCETYNTVDNNITSINNTKFNTTTAIKDEDVASSKTAAINTTTTLQNIKLNVIPFADLSSCNNDDENDDDNNNDGDDDFVVMKYDSMNATNRSNCALIRAGRMLVEQQQEEYKEDHEVEIDDDENEEDNCSSSNNNENHSTKCNNDTNRRGIIILSEEDDLRYHLSFSDKIRIMNCKDFIHLVVHNYLLQQQQQQHYQHEYNQDDDDTLRDDIQLQQYQNKLQEHEKQQEQEQQQKNLVTKLQSIQHQCHVEYNERHQESLFNNTTSNNNIKSNTRYSGHSIYLNNPSSSNNNNNNTITGTLNVTKQNSKEAYIISKTTGQQYFVSDHCGNFNRALHGDIVVASILDKKDWDVPLGRQRLFVSTDTSDTTAIITTTTSKDDEENNGIKVPTVKVISIYRIGKRQYVATLIPPPSDGSTLGARGGGSAPLVVPMNPCIPRIRLAHSSLAAAFISSSTIPSTSSSLSSTTTTTTPNLQNQRIIIEITNWNIGKSYPNGRYIRTIGRIGQLETEIQCLTIEKGIEPIPFSNNALACLPDLDVDVGSNVVDENASSKAISESSSKNNDTTESTNNNCNNNNGNNNSIGCGWTIPCTELLTRKDLRTNRTIFSVDPQGCQDIDDAMHIHIFPNNDFSKQNNNNSNGKNKNNNIKVELGVHIADVTYFVKDGSALDKEASLKATTFYLVDRRFNMLPELLSSDICSLHCDVDRLAVSVLWTFEGRQFRKKDDRRKGDNSSRWSNNNRMENSNNRKEKREEEQKETKSNDESNFCTIDLADGNCIEIDLMNPTNIWYGRTVIRNVAAMTYEQAHSIIHDKNPTPPTSPPPLTAGGNVNKTMIKKLKDDLIMLTQISKSLKWYREVKGGAIDLTAAANESSSGDFIGDSNNNSNSNDNNNNNDSNDEDDDDDVIRGTELKFSLNLNNNNNNNNNNINNQSDINNKQQQNPVVTAVKPKRELQIHRTIAELMIMANGSVARKIHECYPKCSLVRIHRPIIKKSDGAIKLNELVSYGTGRGVRFGDIVGGGSDGKEGSGDGDGGGVSDKRGGVAALPLASMLRNSGKAVIEARMKDSGARIDNDSKKAKAVGSLFQSLTTRALSEALYVCTGEVEKHNKERKKGGGEDESRDDTALDLSHYGLGIEKV